MPLSAHLIVAPVLVPLLAAGLMLPSSDRRRGLRIFIGVLSCLLQLAVAIELLRQAAAGSGQPVGSVSVYLPGNWPAPFGIALAVDSLSATMLLVTALIGTAALLYSLVRWSSSGAHFHALFQCQLMGLNGAFLTADLFNLFVFFEVLLAASYGLLLHGSGERRVKAGLHYIVVNLFASTLFLIGATLIYGVTGTLNMADLALKAPGVLKDDPALLEAGTYILGAAFLVKAACWPLNFWLPTAYRVSVPPVAALFAVMTKVGIYAILRLSTLLYAEVPEPGRHLGSEALMLGGLLTIGFGAWGTLSSQRLVRLASFCVIVSSGTLLTVIGIGGITAIAGALYYMVSSTLAIAAFFLLIELVERDRTIVAVTEIPDDGIPNELDDDVDDDEEPGVPIPTAVAFLGLAFVLGAALLAGLPPMSGFIGKFALLTGVFSPDALNAGEGWSTLSLGSWALLAMLMLSGLTATIALTRAGIRLFWLPAGQARPRLQVLEVLPVAALILVCVALTVGAGSAMRFFDQAAASLYDPRGYVRAVLSAPVVPSPSTGMPR